ncbi:photosynthetic complex putative assembly protein PuhB [Gemmatimonas sp.]|jgi:Bacterial PH domain|uniref:photosynthetic complex putative assembly protein PuhB n=1 Tax=Gemmatimonas sp. TaxID=1962908 RepID=UPI0027B89C25|nr:photosynthetic complex putative assembly protein PuhB [Gemmatimonas sp.]
MNGRDAEEPRYIRGVPHPLPDGERVLWEGAPSARAVAAHVFHWRLLAVYFGVMLAFWFASTTEAVGTPVWWSALLVRVVLAGFVLATAYLLARLVASTTWYAITSERVVLRIGMVLSMSINIPFSLIGAAGVGRFRDGTGQVLLQITPGHRLAYIALWPHCRVFHVNQPQPVLRGLVDPERVAEILVEAVARATAHETTSHLARGTTAAPRAVERRAVPEPASI